MKVDLHFKSLHVILLWCVYVTVQCIGGLSRLNGLIE